MTALVRTTGRVARAAPGAAATPPPRRRAKRVLLLQVEPFRQQRQGAAKPTPRVSKDWTARP